MMVRGGVSGDVYFGLLFSLQRELSVVPGIYSAIVYGSVSRLEHILGKSDLDVLVVIQQDFLEKEMVDRLNRIAGTLFREWRIKIHLRIRNLSDLSGFSSGMLDCGVTSSINKLRDSILLCGSNLDYDYLHFLSSVHLHDIEQNIRMRLSDIRYQIRAMVSTNSDPIYAAANSTALLYRFGCIICQVAEMICYANGMLYVNTKDALSKAKDITGNTLFSEAISIKMGICNPDIMGLISELDRMVGEIGLESCPDLLDRIHGICYHESEDLMPDSTRFRWEQVVRSFPRDESCFFIKEASIGPDGNMTINRKRI